MFALAKIKATYNNTHITICLDNGKLISHCSVGKLKSGVKKSTSYGAQMAAKDAAEKARLRGVRYVNVEVKGFGPGREVSIKGIRGGGLSIHKIIDNTPIPHNGCRPRKKRRL